MTTTTLSPEKLRSSGLCGKLTPEQADRIFFPGSGGKSNEAKKFCDNCPIQRMCLINAIESDLKGFWAGTTDKERTVMARNWHVKVQPIDNVIEQVVVVKRRVLKRVVTRYEDTITYLDSLVNPLDV